MERSEIFERLNSVFRDVFDDDSIIVTETTTAADIDGWDSLMHITLLSAVEDEFDISFQMKEVVKMKNVGDISFYTFMAVGYCIDVYREVVEGEKNPFKLALFLSFFPHIMQGPIDRYDELAPQLYEGHSFDFDRMTQGLYRMLWGFFEKLVVADRLAILVNTIFDHSDSYSGAYLLAAVFCYATSYVGKYLKENYDLPDRRNDAAYAPVWDAAYEKYMSVYF